MLEEGRLQGRCVPHQVAKGVIDGFELVARLQSEEIEQSYWIRCSVRKCASPAAKAGRIRLVIAYDGGVVVTEVIVMFRRPRRRLRFAAGIARSS